MKLDGFGGAGADDEEQIVEPPQGTGTVAAPFAGDQGLQDAAHLGDWQPGAGELEEEHAPGLASGDWTHLAHAAQGAQSVGRDAQLLRVPVVGEGFEVVVELVGVEGPTPLVGEVLDHLR